MSVLLVIPARYGSTRYPGKPLAPLRGAGGTARPLIERTHAAAQAVRGVDRIVIATDDERIAAAARDFGAEAVMTDPGCRNGTERCAAALRALGCEPEIVVNLQGDAPLTPPWFVEALLDALAAAPGLAVATPVLRCDAGTLGRLVADRRAGRVGATTVVFDRMHRALYFSKEVLPFGFDGSGNEDAAPPVFHHVGVYAFRTPALRRYLEWSAGPLERCEGLEQLRFLENGVPVGCVEVQARGRDFWELNNPEDRPLIEAALRELDIP